MTLILRLCCVSAPSRSRLALARGASRNCGNGWTATLPFLYDRRHNLASLAILPTDGTAFPLR